ncbi:hypothetical protein ES703_26483 [subsurface metagenome]
MHPNSKNKMFIKLIQIYIVSLYSGSEIIKVVPLPKVLSTDIVPPCASISDFAIASPKPVSPSFCLRDLSPR